MADDDGGEKPFEATPRKLEEARKRGEVPISQDLITFGVYVAVLTVAIVGGVWSVNRAGMALQVYISAPDLLAEGIFGGGSRFGHGALLTHFTGGIAIWLILPFLFALGVAFLHHLAHFGLGIGQRGFHGCGMVRVKHRPGF